MSKFEVYDSKTGSFTPAAVTELGFFELGGGAPVDVSPSFVLVNMAVYDIATTSINALRQLGKRLPNCYALVSGSPQSIQQIAAAKTGVRLIFDAVHAPLEGGELTPAQRLSQALGAGCVGALVSGPSAELQSHPEAVFFKVLSLTDESDAPVKNQQTQQAS